MRTRTWCVAAALVCLPRLAAAQTVLSEADALARLSADSPRVRAIRIAVDTTRAEALAASRWPNPRVTYNREAVGGVTEHMFLVTQPLPITGRRDFDKSAASALVTASQLRADEELRQIRAAVRAAYADLVSAQVRESEIVASRDRFRELAGILARREAAGDAAGYDRLRAEREVMDLDADLAAAHVDRSRAQAVLAEFFDPSTDMTSLVAVAQSPSPSRTPLPPVEEMLARAQSDLPELAALKQEAASAEFAMRAAERRPIPEPEIVAGTKSTNIGGGDLGSVFSVHVTVPLFDRAKPEQSLAEARRTLANAQLAALQASLRTRVVALHAIVSERRQAADRYRASTATNANQLERIAQVSYDAGERGILELLDAYRNSGAARIRQASLDAATRQAEIELERVSGWEIR
jgi:cobalt-zinc-cadmium efflux system outer membrane protein